MGCKHTKGRAERLVQLCPQQGLRTHKPSRNERRWVSNPPDTASAVREDCEACESWDAREAWEACEG